MGEPDPLDAAIEGPGHGRRRRKVIAGVVVVIALASGAAFALRPASGSDDPATDATAPKTETATVDRTTLTASESYDGTLGYEDAGTLNAQRSGTVTSVAAEGKVVKQGQVLYRIDDQPTILMIGTIPAYRDLSTDSDDGPDVRQLEENLVALGFGDDLTVDEQFTSATADAVEAWEDSLGVDGDGTVELGAVAFEPSAVRIDAILSDVGSSVQTGTGIADLTTQTRTVTVALDSSNVDSLVAGDKVTVTLPGGDDAPATVDRIETTAASTGGAAAAGGSGSGSSDSTSSAIIVLDDQKAADGIDSGSVTVNVVSDERTDVLAVPVTALIALAEGGYAVEVPTGAAGATKLVAVEVGLIDEDLAEVTGKLSEGDEVVVPA